MRIFVPFTMGTIIRLMMLAAHRSVAWSVFVVCETGRGTYNKKTTFFSYILHRISLTLLIIR